MFLASRKYGKSKFFLFNVFLESWQYWKSVFYYFAMRVAGLEICQVKLPGMLRPKWSVRSIWVSIFQRPQWIALWNVEPQCGRGGRDQSLLCFASRMSLPLSFFISFWYDGFSENRHNWDRLAHGKTLRPNLYKTIMLVEVKFSRLSAWAGS